MTNPTTFQAAAMAWLAALSAIVIAVCGVVAFVAPKVAAALQAIKDAQGRLDDHSRRISQVNQTVTDVALLVPPTEKQPTPPT